MDRDALDPDLVEALSGIPAVYAPPRPPSPGPAHGEAGMVSSAHPLATRAGLEMLDAGGNAFDAAVAVAAALGVVEPMMSGIGGYGTILVHDAGRGEMRYLNASGHIPFGVVPDAFRPPTPDHAANRRGAKAVSTPANVPAWEALAAHGRLPWEALLEPAVQLAEEGFVLSDLSSAAIAHAFDDFPPHAREIYGRDGESLKGGDRLVQYDLAASLRVLARDGASALRGGALGRAVDAAMGHAGGFLRLRDLEAVRAEWRSPIGIRYRDAEVLTASPPATAFPALLRLGMMSRYDLRALGHNSAAYLHRFAEVTKLAYAARLRHAGDPEVSPPPLDHLLSEAYRTEQVERIDPERATPFAPPTAFGAGEMGRHTTHFVTADRRGNVASATQTLGNLFGSRIMPEGTGIWLNNSLAYCTFLPPGNPMDAHPGRRKLSGDVPVIVLREGRPWAALGTPGGHTIGQTVPQMAMNLLDFGMGIHEAIAAERVSFLEPDLLVVEPTIPESVRRELAAMGHRVRVPPRPVLGNAHGLTIEYDARGKPVRFTGAADPRGEGWPGGY